MNNQKTIVIFTGIVPLVQPWDPDTIKKGITGSEEAVIYISQQLAALGYKVLVLGDPPEGSPHTLPNANPRFLNVNKARFTEKFDAAIAWRMPSMGKQLKSIAKKVYLWPHDILYQHVTNEEIDFFDDVFWLSDWQRRQWMTVNPNFAKFTRIYGNGVKEEQFHPVQERANPYSCIYGSNYARGLEILLDLWPCIQERQPKATLDIYYGWQHWGNLTPEKEVKMRKQVEKLSNVTDHGLVSHEELNRAYGASSFWTYPCIAAETFCISGLRAQLAGAVPVIIQGSALPETVRHGYKCSGPKDYLQTLLKAFDDAEKITTEDRHKMGNFIRKKYTWNQVASKWKKVIDAGETIC